MNIIKYPKFLSWSVVASVLLLTACGGGGGGSSSGAQLTNNQTSMVAGLADRQTTYYADFTSKTSVLLSSAINYCNSPSDVRLTGLRDNWKSAFLSWQKASWIIQGPVEENDQLLRIESWPRIDASTVPGKVDQVVALAPSPVNQIYMASQAVAAQGFPAMEYLIFSDGVTNASITARQCEVIEAIAVNLNTMSGAVNTDWASYKNAIKVPNSDVEFVDLSESINFLANQFLNLLIVMKDNKVGDPLGIDKVTGVAGNTNIENSEAWRARYSLEALLANMQAIQTLFNGGGAFGIDDYLTSLDQSSVKDSVDSQILNIISSLETLIGEGVTMRDNIDDARITTLYENVRALEVDVQNNMFPAISASITFNFNDGD